MGILPQPQKAKQRERVVRYASLYILHLADIYLQGCRSGKADDMKEFLEWADKRFWEAKKQMDGRSAWNVVFKPGDVYNLSPAQMQMRKAEAIVGLEGIAKFLQCNARLFWDAYSRSNSLTKFTTEFIPAETKKIAYGRY